MPKHRLRAPGEPLAERPGDDPHIPEMLARTLFRDGTLRRRATRGPRLSIFTEENHARTNHAQTQTQTRTHTVSPEDAPRAPGTASPVSPPTPTPSNLARLPVSIAIEPATPSSEPGPGGHWYFHDVRNNHYEETRVSIGTHSECTTLALCPDAAAPMRCVSGGDAGKWGVRGVRRWLRAWRERRAREGVARARAKEGELVVRERVVLGGGSAGEASVGLDDAGKRPGGSLKGVRGKARDLARKGTRKLRTLQPGREEVPALPKKEVWKPMRRIRGFQHIE